RGAARERQTGVKTAEQQVVVAPDEKADREDREAEKPEEVAGGRRQWIAEEEVFQAEEVPLGDEFAQHGGEADGAGEEDANHGVARQAGALTDRDDPQADEDAEPRHQRRDPVPEVGPGPMRQDEGVEEDEA